MSEECDERTLIRKTEDYWGDLQRNAKRRDPVWRAYVENLLPLEMACMAAAPDRLPQAPCQMLVLLVGQSVEPLLQSVWAHRPKELLLILNRQYDEETTGDNFASTVRGLLSQLPSEQRVAEENIQQQVVEPRPANVFRALVERLRDREGVVIDITGAKKSMVAGAFLYAAYANVPVSYVDFDDVNFSAKYGKPYGYASHIRSFENPYTAFALRDWEQVRQLYRRYKFRDARRLLLGEDGNDKAKTVLATMRKYLPESAPATRALADLLRCYELWDAGLYNESAEHAQKIAGFQPPTAVGRLGGKWFEVDRAQFKEALPNFYEDTPEFRAYVYDELARIERLIDFNHDYRSAFLRAGSLNEVVMLARLVKLVDDDPQKDELVRALQNRTPGAYSVFDNLRKRVGHSFQIGPQKNDTYYEISSHGAPEITITIAEPMDWWREVHLFEGQGSWKHFINRRNDLAHKYYSPPHEWAQDVLSFVQANVEDFWEADTAKDIDTEALPWSEMCGLTGLKEYLPPNLLTDVDA